MNPGGYVHIKELRVQLNHLLVTNQDTDTMLEEFMGQKDGAAKTRFVLEKLKERNDQGKDSSLKSKVFQPKSDSASLAARNEGNKYFIKEKDFVSAVECYNRSICLATENSENLAIGYANRSAVYLNSGFYKFCLQNIDLALKNNYPEKLRPKLEQRKKECLELMNNRQDSLEKFNKDKIPAKLSYPASEQIPIMIEGLELARSEQFGRHIVTKCDLYPGDIIIIEEPFAKCVVNDDEYSRCANCLDQNHMNLFPCCHCTRAMFCSEDCRQEAWNRFHKYECPIIDGIIKSFDKGFPLVLALRLSLYAFTMFDDPEELQKLIKDIDVETETAFDLDYDHLTERNHFRAIYAHGTHESVRSCVNLFQYTKWSAIAWHLLSNYTDLRLMLKSKDMEDFFLNILFRFTLATPNNCQELGMSLTRRRMEIGTGCFALCCLLNHSCAPNVSRIVDGITNVIIVRRVIKAGEQLFDNIGPNHCDQGKEERQKLIKKEAYFDCQCEACVHDYPTYKNMPASEGVREKILNEQKRFLAYDRDFAKQTFKKYRKYLKNYRKKYPCWEVCASEDNLIGSLCALMLDMPLELQLKPLDFKV